MFGVQCRSTMSCNSINRGAGTSIGAVIFIMSDTHDLRSNCVRVLALKTIYTVLMMDIVAGSAES